MEHVPPAGRLCLPRILEKPNSLILHGMQQFFHFCQKNMHFGSKPPKTCSCPERPERQFQSHEPSQRVLVALRGGWPRSWDRTCSSVCEWGKRDEFMEQFRLLQVRTHMREADGILVHLWPWPVMCLPSLSWGRCHHRTPARKAGSCARGHSQRDPWDSAHASWEAWDWAHQGDCEHWDEVEELRERAIQRGEVGRCQRAR